MTLLWEDVRGSGHEADWRLVAARDANVNAASNP